MAVSIEPPFLLIVNKFPADTGSLLTINYRWDMAILLSNFDCKLIGIKILILALNLMTDSHLLAYLAIIMLCCNLVP